MCVWLVCGKKRQTRCKDSTTTSKPTPRDEDQTRRHQTNDATTTAVPLWMNKNEKWRMEWCDVHVVCWWWWRRCEVKWIVKMWWIDDDRTADRERDWMNSSVWLVDERDENENDQKNEKWKWFRKLSWCFVCFFLDLDLVLDLGCDENEREERILALPVTLHLPDVCATRGVAN